MTRTKNLLIALGALLTLGVGATAAQAAPAYAASTVNVRAGAGTGYPVVDTLRRGERVDIEYCRGSWCYVNKSGPDGWVSANYLNSDRDRYDRYDRRDRYDDYYYYERPRFRPHRPFRPYFGSQVCVGGNHASFCVRD